MMTEDAVAGGGDSSSETLQSGAQMERMMERRAQIAAEILETERTYVDGLTLIEKLFITPLLASAQQAEPILTRKEVRQVFANFPDIVMLSRELLGQLEGRLGAQAQPAWTAASGRVGDIFQRMAPFMKMYSLYLRNFRSALADISAWLGSKGAFAAFVQRASARGECRGLTFQSYLLLPVQRIPRYRLLLSDLQRHTPAGHVDGASIAAALQMIEGVAEFVNENIWEHEMALSMVEIQRALGLKETLLAPGRRLVKAGVLTKICRKSHQQRSFYLFSDMLLYSSGQDEAAGHRRVALEDCKVMDVPDAGDSRNQFTLISREKSFIVYAGDAGEKAAWMGALSQAIVAQREARGTLQMDRSQRRRLARARRSTLMEHPRVAENFDAPVWAPDESAARCYICFRAFTLFVRRHHCRACGNIVCNACSRKSIVFVGRDAARSEGRGCDQCIARLFGRDALESPPGSVHRFLARSRHSLDAGTLMQSLAALKLGGSSTDNDGSACKDSKDSGTHNDGSTLKDSSDSNGSPKRSPPPPPRPPTPGDAASAASTLRRARASTYSTGEWDASARTTVLCSSPASTVSRHRASVVSSCSTIGGRAASAAPPALTLVQASAERRRGGGTRCALCRGDVAQLDSQHQCGSCLALVCAACIRPATYAGPDGAVCASCGGSGG